MQDKLTHQINQSIDRLNISSPEKKWVDLKQTVPLLGTLGQQKVLLKVDKFTSKFIKQYTKYVNQWWIF